jgi:hypothetical protein
MKLTQTSVFLLALIVVFLAVAPVSALNLVYPDEYYDLGNESWHVAGARVNDFGQYFGIYSELRRQNILLERQNELISDLTAVLANQSQKSNSPQQVIPSMKWECTSSGSQGCFGWMVTQL